MKLARAVLKASDEMKEKTKIALETKKEVQRKPLVEITNAPKTTRNVLQAALTDLMDIDSTQQESNQKKNEQIIDDLQYTIQELRNALRDHKQTNTTLAETKLLL
jgi:tRNA/tmRNA/rRNA uracil-C5-methylase (TrmA/RlmC/RlmD family)